MSSRNVWLLVASALAVTVATIVWYTTDAAAVGYTVAYVALCGLAWWSALRRQSPRDRGPWALVAAALSLWGAGNVLELVEYYLVEVPHLTPDVLWLGGYPVLAVALVRMARRRAPGRLRGAALDGMTVAVAAGVASWQFFIAPWLAEGYTVVESTVTALYPVADVVLLAAVLLIALSPGTRTAPTRLLLCAIFGYLGVDVGLNVGLYFADYAAFEPLNSVILLANALLVAAGLHPRRAELTRAGHQVPSLHPARVLFLGLALMTAPTLTLVSSGIGQDQILALVATAVCAAFVLARFTIAVREQERAQASLVFQARHDPLTGLANRTTLGDRLARQVAAPDAAVTVLYLDLDGFKQVNDQHGHDAGDAVLLAVAARLSAAVREGDLVARLGGDEFVLLCPGVPEDEAVRLAERVLHDVAQPVAFRGHQFTVGASIGIAARAGGAGEGAAAVLRTADAAMYQAKRLGRGRWILAEPALAG
ncbi:hypothetical protein GCM10020358_36580 [Amorphoplanes nipponensis]|uniref:GGDEF domain-containing protein n=1 Tax=Actinoplanes nipponensis TaxID=135950 RepID=A0A919JN42_9ACTN|nr:GGDEF domain-containing protein [Actinoplanes nipponensis]GIE53833.1 hypothetical protein Ani05nite_73670 [Actinoplanes nipponensis]